jgi:hypothetical protein
MKVTYSLAAQDLPVWSKYNQRRRSEAIEEMPLYFSIFTLPLGFFAVPLAVFAVLYILEGDSASILWVTLASAAVWGPTYWAIRWRLWTKRALKRLSVQWTIGVEPDGVSYASSSSEGRLSWSNFSDIGENSRYIFFFTKGGAALIVPKRAFADPGDARSFVDMAIAYWAEKRSERSVDSAKDSWPPSPKQESEKSAP